MNTLEYGSPAALSCQAQNTAPYYWYHSFRVFTFSENCLDWIGTHTDLEWETMDRVNADRLASYQG